ncbi:cupin domain-containing protein [Kaarinaea lacus]
MDEYDSGVNTTTAEYGTEIVTVRPSQEVLTRQQLPYFLGISRNTVGAKHLSMNLVVIPPGARAEPHYHKDFETGIYVLQGRVETRYGEGLKKSVINETGDFVFIPPNLPHQPINLSNTETAIGIVVRDDPNEQENVVPYQLNEKR